MKTVEKGPTGTYARPAYARRGFVTFGAISLLLIFFVGEVSLQKLMVLHTWSLQTLQSSYCSCQFDTDEVPASSSFNQQKNSNRTHLSSPRIILIKPTVHEAFENKVTYIRNMSSQTPAGKKFRTSIDKNKNVHQFGLTTVRNVCMRPDGAIVMVGMTEGEIRRHISQVPALEQEWRSSYNCSTSAGCVGFETADHLPPNVTLVPGTTVHILPYLGNVFHHFADRIWPHIAGFQYPLNETSAHPVNHFIVHRFSTWMDQAHHNMDRNTLMYQIRILGRQAPKADFLLVDGLKPKDLVCYESLVLACATCDRISNKLGFNITSPALLAYRHAALNYFRVREPAVPLPPHPLRVTFYGRRDTKRRRIVNSQEVVDHLKKWTNPPLDVVFVDDLMASGKYNQSLPEAVSLFSQTDIFITPHGANTWTALFMPKHAAVIEIYGPCGPSTWLGTIIQAVGLKHSTKSNPYDKIIASPLAGNTTECEGALRTPDFTIDIPKLDHAIHKLALPMFGSRDRIPRHWLYDWTSHGEYQEHEQQQAHVPGPHVHLQ
ncbi:hypothetical protein Mapa_002082 [Marchantia paleacea]|nr:hypothetical protein Mapa_002082 [Marchantia paleacea]